MPALRALGPPYVGVEASPVEASWSAADLCGVSGDSCRKASPCAAALTEWSWQNEWNMTFAQEIAREAVKSDVPPSRWMAGGKTKYKPAGENRQWWMENGPGFASNWESFLDGHPDWEVWESPHGLLGVELPLEFEAGGGLVKVIPDRIYRTPRGVVLVDLKSGAKKPDGGYQLPIQQMAMDVLFGEQVAGSYYWMARKNELIESTSPVVYDRAVLDDVFATAWAQIESGAFLANPGSQCNRCSVFSKCAVVGGSL